MLGRRESRREWWGLEEMETREERETKRLGRIAGEPGQRGKPSYYGENKQCLWGGEPGKVRKPRRLVWGSELYNCSLRIGTEEPGGCTNFAMQPQEQVNEAICAFRQGQGKWLLLWRRKVENLFLKFHRNAGFYLTTRNSAVVQCELIPGHLYFLRPNSHRWPAFV